MKTLALIIFICLYFFFVYEKEKWIGFYYPNENDLTNHFQSPEYKSIDQCRNWINGQVSIHNPSGLGYDYECGKNCKVYPGSESDPLYICKETIR